MWVEQAYWKSEGACAVYPQKYVSVLEVDQSKEFWLAGCDHSRISP